MRTLGEEERHSDAEFLGLTEDERWLYLHRYLKRLDSNTNDVVQWTNSLKGGLALLYALATIGKWLLAVGATWAAFKYVILK